MTIFSVVLIAVDIYQHNLSLTIFVLYVWLIYLLFPGIIEPNPIKLESRKFLGKAIWVLFAGVLVLTVYVRYLPHGPMINMGEECVEYNDGRSTSCGDRYVEDTRRLNIPDWAKLLRDSGGTILIALFIAGAAASQKDEHGQ